MGYFIPINPPFISRFSITNPLIHPNFPIDPFLTFRPKRDISAFPAFSGQVLRFKRCRATVNAPPVVDSEVFRAALATASWPSSQNVDPKNGIENGGVPKGTPKKTDCWGLFFFVLEFCYFEEHVLWWCYGFGTFVLRFVFLLHDEKGSMFFFAEDASSHMLYYSCVFVYWTCIAMFNGFVRVAHSFHHRWVNTAAVLVSPWVPFIAGLPLEAWEEPRNFI